MRSFELSHLWKPSTIVGVVAVVLGLMWTSLLTNNGIRFSGDSGVFMVMAMSMKAGEWKVPAIRAPLYPMLWGAIATIEPFGADAASYLSGFSLIAVLVGLGFLTLELSRNTWVSVLVVLVAAGWPALLTVFHVAWTEQLYMALFVLHLLFVVRHMRHERVGDLTWAAILAGAIMYTRYLGVSLMAAFALYVVTWAWRSGRRRAKDFAFPIGLLGLVSLPLAGHLASNYFVEGTLTGERRETERTVLHNAARVVGEVQEGLVQVGLVSVLAVASVLVLLLLRSAKGRSLTQQANDGMVMAGAGYLGLTVGSYLLLLLSVTSTVALDGITNRFVSPLFPAILVLVASGVGAAERLWPGRRLPAMVAQVGLLLGAAQMLPSLDAEFAVLEERKNKFTYHNQFGYGDSDSAKGLSALLGSIIAESGDTTISVLSHPRSPVGHSLLQRRGTWAHSGLEIEAITDHKPRSYTIQASESNRPIVLHYEAVTPIPVGRNDRLVERVQEAFEAQKVNRLLLVVSAATVGDLKLRKNFSEAFSPYVVTEVGEAKPYTVYWVSDERRSAEKTKSDEKIAKMPRAESERKVATKKTDEGKVDLSWKVPSGGDADRFRFEDGVVSIDTNAATDARQQMVCQRTWRVKDNTKLQVVGALKTDGIGLGAAPYDVGARVVMLFMDQEKNVVRAGSDDGSPTTVIRRIGDNDWQSFKKRVKVPTGAVKARICLEVIGTAGIGHFKDVRWKTIP